MNDPRPNDASRQDDTPARTEPAPRWVKNFGAVLMALLFLFVIIHLAGGGFRRHGS